MNQVFLPEQIYNCNYKCKVYTSCKRFTLQQGVIKTNKMDTKLGNYCINYQDLKFKHN